MCGILGIISKNDDCSIKLFEGLSFLQHRGQDSVGISNGSKCIKKNGLVKNSLTNEDLIEIKSKIGIGHVRYRTNGEVNESTIQPLLGNVLNNKISLCHNGNVTNIEFIKSIIGQEELHTDSEYILKLFIEKINTLGVINYENIITVCKFIIYNLVGSFSILILIENYGIISFRDKFGIRPLIYGVNTDGYIVSSESVVLDVLNYNIVRDVEPGEMIVFENNSPPRFSKTKNTTLNPCLFEYIYFSRIDSIIDGISVYDARYQMGILLGERIKKMNLIGIDMIVPVPESSLIFALGLQECLNIKIQYGLVKNPYIDRTFIMKEDKIINKSIKRKLNAVKTIMNGKNILIVDDSIVRGNTSFHIVNIVKNAGAKKIYIASGAPHILYPNKYGIFIESRNELIAVDRSEKDIADVIGCNGVIYNDLEEIINSLKKYNPNINGFEVSMFNDKHLF